MSVAGAAQVTPYLPSGQQMRSGHFPASVESQIEYLGLRILQRLFAPLVRRWQARRARRMMLQATLAAISTTASARSPEALTQEAAEAALAFTSAIGQAMPSLNGGAESEEGESDRGPLDGTAASRRQSTRPPRASFSSGTLGSAAGVPQALRKAEGDDEDEDENTAGDAPTAQSSPTDKEEDGGSGSPMAALSPEMLFSADMVAAGAVAAASSPIDRGSSTHDHQQQRPLSAGQQRELQEAKLAIHNTVQTHLTLRTYLQLEHIQSLQEPSHEVLILLSGSLRRRYPVVGMATGTIAAVDAPVGSPRLGGSAAGGVMSPNSRRASASFTSAASTPTRASTAAVRSRTGGLRATTRRGSQFHQEQQQGQLRRGSRVLATDVLKAPLVLGEMSVLGGFPYCEELVVESERCVVGSLSKEAYCELVATLSKHVQKRLMVAALRQREHLMPFFAPMTLGRLRLCPLLSLLAEEELTHIRDHLVPKVFAAGMLCSESTDPQHVFFVRRGLVRMEREGFANVERGAATSPKNRTILVEGQTFGETPCIFRESLGDAFYALSHVDAYLLPFRVIIQLMKQQPEVQALVYKCARAISVLREKDFEGVLRFNPFGCEVYGLQGVTSRRSSIFGNVAAVSSRRGSYGARAGTTVAGSRYGSRANSVVEGGATAPSVHFTMVGTPSIFAGANGTGNNVRRVTIFEEEGQQTATGDGGLVGGRVSTDLVAAMRRIPLLSLIAPAEVMDEMQRFWRCVRYEKGDIIVRRGEECNRVLLFLEGRAAIILDENALQRELQPTPFGTADLAVLASAQTPRAGGGSAGAPVAPTPASAGLLQTVPAGHAVGYTCVLRHRWTRTVIAVDDTVEVWELSRASLVGVLRRHSLERRMWTVAQQVLQPLVAQKERFYALDYQPLCRPMPSSLWSEQPLVNVHPVRLSEASLFPVWREGDFPLDRVAMESR